jgi:hypothetical protein
MNKLNTLASLLFVASICPLTLFGSPNRENSEKIGSIIWDVNNLKSIGGQKTAVLGSPNVI